MKKAPPPQAMREVGLWNEVEVSLRTGLHGLIAHPGGGLRSQNVRPRLPIGCIQQGWRREVEELIHVHTARLVTAGLVLPVGIPCG